jgi:hypothetical protein
MKPMTAAEYAAHAEAVDAKRPVVVKTLTSGSVFALRKPDLQRMVILGLIPQTLLDEGVKAWEASGVKAKGKQAKIQVSEEAARNGLITMREVVRDACVSPPFNEVTANYFLRQDFDEIYYWAMGHEGVTGAESAKTFRKGRKGRTSIDSADGKKLQPQTISTAEN